MWQRDPLKPHVRESLDPLDHSLLPQGAPLALDYRTEPEGAKASRSAAKRFLALTVLSCFATVLLTRTVAAPLHAREGLLLAFSRFYWCVVFPVMGMIALIKYIRGRRKPHLFGWLFVPALTWAVLHITAAGFEPLGAYLMLFVPTLVLVAWICDRMANHYAAWLNANPLLELEVRKEWTRRWAARRMVRPSEIVPRIRQTGFLGTQPVNPEIAEPALYPLGFIAALGSAALAFIAFAAYRAFPGGRFFAGMLAVFTLCAFLVGVWGLWNWHLQPHRLRVKTVLGVSWSALLNWLAYNTHETNAPGVFQSPGGSCRHRRFLFCGALFLLSLSILPLSAYFPAVLMVSGPAPWLDAIIAPTKSTEVPTEPPTVAGLDESERLYLSYLKTDAERNAYLERVAARRSAETLQREAEYNWTQAYAALTAAPEGWFWHAFRRTFALDWYYSLAFFVSMALSLVASPLAFFLIFTFLCGRLLTLFYAALEAPGAYQHRPNRSAWDGRVQRLGTSSVSADWLEMIVSERDHLWLGTSATNDYPILLSRRILSEHAHILGSSGSGKTALGLAPLMTQLIRLADSSVVIIDLKGDNALFTGAREEAEAAGLPFQWFTDELGSSTFVFNPLLQAHRARLSTLQRTDLLMGAFGLHYSRAYGEAYYSDIQNHLLFRALRHEPDCPSFRRLYELLRNRALYRDMDKKELRDAAHIWKIVDRLASFPSLNACEGDGVSQRVLDNAIDMGEVFSAPRVLYFYLPAALESLAVEEIARLALYNLLTAAVKAKGQRTQVYLFIDEFQQIVSSNLEIILRQARKFGIGVILANQAIADLKTREVDLTPVVSANTNLKQIFSVADVFHQDMLIKASGEAMYEMVSVTEKWTEPNVVRTQESVGPRLWRNDIIDFSNHPQRSLVQIDRGHGFTQFGGYPFVMVSKFHITKKEYERRDRAPWPDGDPRTITPQPDAVPQTPRGGEASAKRGRGPKVDYSEERGTLEKFLNEVMAKEGVESEADEDGSAAERTRKPNGK